MTTFPCTWCYVDHTVNN
uniref:Uncharacterized protein n=1 Tax=Anguilla anguilla TaxID=7936 RepID=A0A0E9S6T6_ANGAN